MTHEFIRGTNHDFNRGCIKKAKLCNLGLSPQDYRTQQNEK